MFLAEMAISADTILTSIVIVLAALGAVVAVKLEVRELKVDMRWVKETLNRIRAKIGDTI